MPQFLRAADRPPGTFRFDGEDHGAGLSFFAVVAAPGKSVGLHVHPYPEIWMVQDGTVRLTAGTETIEAGPGDVVIVPADTPHGFVNPGPDSLRMMCLHPSPRIVQTFLDPDDG